MGFLGNQLAGLVHTRTHRLKQRDGNKGPAIDSRGGGGKGVAMKQGFAAGVDCPPLEPAGL